MQTVYLRLVALEVRAPRTLSMYILPPVETANEDPFTATAYGVNKLRALVSIHATKKAQNAYNTNPAHSSQ